MHACHTTGCIGCCDDCLQEKSYFAVRLPHGWWLFGLDLALVDGERKPAQHGPYRSCPGGCLVLQPIDRLLYAWQSRRPACQGPVARSLAQPPCWLTSAACMLNTSLRPPPCRHRHGSVQLLCAHCRGAHGTGRPGHPGAGGAASAEQGAVRRGRARSTVPALAAWRRGVLADRAFAWSLELRLLGPCHARPRSPPRAVMQPAPPAPPCDAALPYLAGGLVLGASLAQRGQEPAAAGAGPASWQSARAPGRWAGGAGGQAGGHQARC